MAFNFQRDSVIVSRLAQFLRFPLECERQSLEKGEHHEYQQGVSLARQWFDRRLEQIRIEEKEEEATISSEYEEGIRQLDQEYAMKIKELEESFLKEQDEQKRSLDNEINALDIAISPLVSNEDPLTNCGTHHQPGQCQQYQNAFNVTHTSTAAIGGKKFLRSRQNDAIPSSSGGIESALYLSSVGLNDGTGTIGGLKRRMQTKKNGSPFGLSVFANAGITAGGFAGAINGGSTVGGTATTSSLMLPYLLSEAAISEDVHLFDTDPTNHCLLVERPPLGSRLSQDRGGGDRLALSSVICHSTGGEMPDEEGGDKSTGSSGKHHRRVLLEQNKLILDAKTFHRFQKVYLELTSSAGRMPATIRSISEGRYVEFRSVIPGDTRTFTATKDDLERGRVFVQKRY